MSFSRWQKLTLCLSIGVVGMLASTVPAVLEFDETAGLDWLFRLRGPIEAPTQVVLVSIDTESATALGLHPDPDRWPRSLHAQLIERLTSAGAAVIAFDIIFDSPRDPVEDRELARAIQEAGNVVLLERLRTRTVPTGSLQLSLDLEERIPPIPALRRAAVATAPFPLPLVPVKVSQFWAFGPADPTVLTLPAVTLHAYWLDAHEEFVALLEEVRPGTRSILASQESLTGSTSLATVGSEIRNLIRSDPGITGELMSRIARSATDPPNTEIRMLHREKLKSLIRLYGGPDSRYLNLYGPARSIETVPYHLIVSDGWEPAASNFSGKAVFVGFSEQNATEQQDTFYTAFSARTGVSLSGAEIGANAFANLLDGSSVRPLSMPRHLMLVLLWGTTIAAMLAWLPTPYALATVAVAGSGYVLLASALFRSFGIWLPILVPVFGLIPLALLSVFGWKYAHARLQSERARRTLSFYLPPRVVEQLSREPSIDRPQPQLLHGTCLVTDAEEFTSLSERISPQELHSLLNEYYAVLFTEVEQRGGFVADITGDSMVAVWASTERDPTARANASRAAQAILSSVEKFNFDRAGPGLPTRIGIHSGQVLLGDVGAESHFEYRAVGDIVNTASRIQGLNKQLHTNLLVSEEALEGTDYTFARRIGKFVLAGKSVPLVLYDMVSIQSHADPERKELAEQFEAALAIFCLRQWRNAAEAFENVLARFPNDGPSAFYLGLSRDYDSADPGDSWSGVVTVSKK